MKDYVSFSSWGQYQNCQARALAMDKGEWNFQRSEAMLVSSWIEQCLIGTEESKQAFFEENPEALNSRTGEPKAKFKQAEEIAEAAKKDEVFMATLQGEYQVALEGTIGGVAVRGYADVVNENFITDLKAVANFTRAWNPVSRTKESFIGQRKYATQGAIYQELYRQKTGKILPFYLSALTKEEYSKRVVATFPQDTLDFHLEQFEKSLHTIVELRQGVVEPVWCGDCDYCRTHQEAELTDYRFVGMTNQEKDDFFWSREDREEDI